MTQGPFSEADVAGCWNASADARARAVRHGHDVAREGHGDPALLSLIGDLRGRQVPDAGCGEGHTTRILARAGARMPGVDVSARMIELAREEERRAPPGIGYACTSYADLGRFRTGSFDAVVSFMALMDGADFEAAMREGFRVLRPGGMLAVSLTHPCVITRGSRWIRDEHGARVAWVVSLSFDPVPWVDRWRFTGAPAGAPPFAVPGFDRTLSQYLNGVLDAGSRLRRIAEPRPSEPYCAAHPSQRGWRDHAALFLHVRAEKPGAPPRRPARDTAPGPEAPHADTPRRNRA